MTEIRPMRPTEIPAVVDMIHALNAFHAYEGTITADRLTRDTDPTNPWMHVYVAERAGALVGYMILLPLAKIADGLRGIDINHMYVAEAARGTGIAHRFVATAKDHAARHQCSYMLISTAPDNAAAQKAYLACGFAAHPSAGGPRFRLQLET